MELEVKHLSSYLPYSLKLQYIVRDKVVSTGVMKSISHNDFETNPTRININYQGEEHIWMFKPILRPLSDLKLDNWKKEIQQLHPTPLTFSEYHSGNDNPFDFTFTISYKMMGDTFTEILVNRGLIEDTKYSFIQFLLKNHFDIFNLIPENLAIDINTLK
jgi:hypothetical protein